MSDGRTIDSLGAGSEQGISGTAKGGTGGADIIDEQHAVACQTVSCREAPASKLHPRSAGSSGLAPSTVAPKGGYQRSVDGPRDLCPEKTCGTKAPPQATQAARRNRGHDCDLLEPGCEGDPRRQTTAEGARDLVMTLVFERQDRLSKGTIVGAPQDGAQLRRRRGDATEAGLGLRVGRDAAKWTTRLGHGVKSAAARTTEPAVVAGENLFTRDAQSGQENLRNCRY